VQKCSNRGVYVTSGQSAQVTLNNFTLWTNSTGLQSDGGPVTLAGGLVQGNSGTGISGGPLTATETIVSQNSGTGIAVYNNTVGTVLTGCVVTNNHGDGVYGQNVSLQLNGCTVMSNGGNGVNNYYGSLSISGCTMSHNNGWGVSDMNNNGGGPPAAEIWNNLVQSNGNGGITMVYNILAGLVSNTISGNLGTGLNLNLQIYGGVSASGITGNAIWGNGGVGVEVQGNTPSVLTLSGNDIYQNTTFELRNDSSITVIANGNYWGNPTGTELGQGRKNLSRIYDILDGGPAEVLITNWYAASFSGGNPGP